MLNFLEVFTVLAVMTAILIRKRSQGDLIKRSTVEKSIRWYAYKHPECAEVLRELAEEIRWIKTEEEPR